MLSGFTQLSPMNNAAFTSLVWGKEKSGRDRLIALVSDCATGGDATDRLAARLCADGWRVTILDVSLPEAPDHKSVAGSYQRLAGLYSETNSYIQMQSLTAYHWLRDRSFDLVLFHHEFAVGFYSCMARHRGLAFEQTPLVIVAAAPRGFRLEQAQDFPSGRHDFETDFMERRSVELADGLLVEDAAIGTWLQQTGWIFPRVAAIASPTPAAGSEAFGAWLSWIADAPQIPDPEPEPPIFISVCMAIYNRAAWLRDALASLEAQTYSFFEVVVVDDGSDATEIAELRKELEPLFKARAWRWERKTHAGPAAARNYAAQIARGGHLLFMDDDNIAFPDELERFARAARKDYAILTCILGMHPESELAFSPTALLPSRTDSGTRPVGWTPIGGDLLLATLINVAGETNSLFRRDIFEQLGGFSTHPQAVLEDFDLLTRALIAGYRIDVVPEVLMLYRRSRQSRSMTQDIFAGHLHSLHPIAALLPESLRPLLLALRREWYRRHSDRRKQD